MKYNELCRRITDRMIASLESGKTGEIKPLWHQKPSSWWPTNATTNKSYRGINVVLLAEASDTHDYASSTWATYKQWHGVGAQVRKGERGHQLVKWVPKKSKDDPEVQSSEPRLIPLTFSVFNADQVDGWETEVRYQHSPVERAEAWIAASQAVINYEGNRAFYSPKVDQIWMPPKSVFPDQVDFYSVLCHELVHWTSHMSRLDRPNQNQKSSNEYAFEELIAELGAAFGCARLGLSVEPRADHGAYLAHYVALMRADPMVLVKAATKAQQAVEFIEGFQPPELADETAPEAIAA